MKKRIITLLIVSMILSGCSHTTSTSNTKGDQDIRNSVISSEKKTEKYILSKNEHMGENISDFQDMINFYNVEYEDLVDNGDGTYTLCLTQKQLNNLKNNIDETIKKEETIVEESPYDYKITVSDDYKKIILNTDYRGRLEYGYVTFGTGKTEMYVYSVVATSCTLMQILNRCPKVEINASLYLGMTGKLVDNLNFKSFNQIWPLTDEQFKNGVTLNSVESKNVLEQYSDYTWCTINISEEDKYLFLKGIANGTDEYQCFYTPENKDQVEICYDKNAEMDLIDSLSQYLSEEITEDNPDYSKVNFTFDPQNDTTEMCNYILKTCAAHIIMQTLMGNQSDYNLEITILDQTGSILVKEHSINKVIEYIKEVKNKNDN